MSWIEKRVSITSPDVITVTTALVTLTKGTEHVLVKSVRLIKRLDAGNWDMRVVLDDEIDPVDPEL